MLKHRRPFLYENASAASKTWISHAAMLTYVIGWLTAWAALSFFYPALRLLWIFTLPAAALVLWAWFVDDEDRSTAG